MADDYVAHELSIAGCTQWQNYFKINSENAIGFNFVATNYFCNLPKYFGNDFAIVNFFRLLFSLLLIFLVNSIYLGSKKRIYLLHLSMFECLTWLLFTSTKEPFIYLSIGPTWSMQWIQHSLPYILCLISVGLYARNKRDNWPFSRTLSFCLFIVFSMQYSSLNFAFLIPVAALFSIEMIRLSLADSKYWIVFYSHICFVGFSVFKLISNQRGFKALESQSDYDTFIYRIGGVLFFTFRELFITNLLPILTFFILGVVISKKLYNIVALKNTLMFFAYCVIILVIVESFTYYAAWHHRSLNILLYLVCIQLGTNLEKLNRTKYLIVNVLWFILFTTIFTRLISSYTLLSNHCNNWNREWRLTVSSPKLIISDRLDLKPPPKLPSKAELEHLYRAKCGPIPEAFRQISNANINTSHLEDYLDYHTLRLFNSHLQSERVAKWII